MTNNDAPNEINYKLKGRFDENPQYKYLRIPLSSLSTGLNSGEVDISTASQLLEFKCPSTEVFNLAKSYLHYTVSLGKGGASNFTWMYEDTLSTFENISFETMGNERLAYVQFVDKYVKVARKLNTSIGELLTNDKASLLHTCNSLATLNNVPAATPTDKGTVNYIEPRYSIVSSAVDTEIDKQHSFPLSGISNTIFSYDKDLFFGQEMYIRMNTTPVNRITWTSTSGIDPVAGTAKQFTGTAKLKNIYLYLAIEKNQVIKQDIMSKYAAGKFHINIPYTQGYQHSIPAGATVGNVQLSISKQYGSRIMQILHTVYNGLNKLNKSYDNDNSNGAKVEKYRTNLGTKYLQDYEMVCANNDDWYQANKRYCNDTAILNNDVYNLNWFHIDRFYSSDQDIENNDVGRDIPEASIDWIFESTVNASNSKLFLTYVTSRRGYTISPIGVVPDTYL